MFTCCTDGSKRHNELADPQICMNLSGVFQLDFKDKWAEELKGAFEARKVPGTFDFLELSNAGVIRFKK